MKYAYEDMHEDQFEVLIVILCQRLLGISVKGFAKGKDGGKDAKFVGKAELHPSTVAPWIGTTIVQAKHTIGYNKSFSESDFFSKTAKSTVINDEIPRIKKLRENKQLDHYMLFSNRRLTGIAEDEITEYLSEQCNIPKSSIYLCGIEQLELWLNKFSEVATEADLDPVDSPLIVSPDDLAEVVQALGKQISNVSELLDDPPAQRVPYEHKNMLNNMTPEYSKYQRDRYLKETAQIHSFLANPENLELMRLYESTVDEFQSNIIAKRRDYQTFDEVMQHLTRLLFERDAVLRQREHKRLTRAVLFYMYWNCDIGENGDDSADQTLSS